MEERTASTPSSRGVGVSMTVGWLGIRQTAAIFGMLAAGVATAFFFMRRRARPTLRERVRETVLSRRPAIRAPVVTMPALAETVRFGIGRGGWLSGLMGRRTRPGFETASERAREIAESAQRTTQQIGRAIEHDVLPRAREVVRTLEQEALPRAREVGRTYGPIAQGTLERSLELGGDMLGRVQQLGADVLPQVGRRLRDVRTPAAMAMPKSELRRETATAGGWLIGLPLRVLGSVFGGLFRFLVGVVLSLASLAALAGVLIFIYAPERPQREQLFRQIGSFTAGVGEFINDVRQAFGEASQAEA